MIVNFIIILLFFHKIFRDLGLLIQWHWCWYDFAQDIRPS